jgi:hypothetical protein
MQRDRMPLRKLLGVRRSVRNTVATGAYNAHMDSVLCAFCCPCGLGLSTNRRTFYRPLMRAMSYVPMPLRPPVKQEQEGSCFWVLPYPLALTRGIAVQIH